MKSFSSLALIPWLLAVAGRSLSPFSGATPDTPPQDTLTVAQCREQALQNSPLQQKKLYAESVAALQIRDIKANSLPRINIGGQASWQSDVFGFPGDSPLFQVPEVPKDQYKLTLDVSQRIWDGGSDRFIRRQRELENELAAAQTDVDAFRLREVVTDLYFKALLLQESEAVLQNAQTDLERRLKQAEAAVAEGAALRTSADQVRIQMLKNEQQIAAAHADRQALLEVLAKWINRPQVDFALTTPDWENAPLHPETRPEFRLFDLQRRMYTLQQDRLQLSLQPRIEAFGQAGFGRPNPFNFFETGLEPFAIVGLRVSWTPIDWGRRSREAQVLELQSRSVTAQRDYFLQSLEAGTIREFWDLNVKYKEQIGQDDAIITLQEDIVRRAEAQVKNGVMTDTDYLAQLNLLTQSRLTRKTHEIQAAQAREMLVAKLGSD
ncbi:MAG: TolC family protein [Lewinellaceae bacterium]|nr:TolC family protein [Lewinellaceae bacterium]